MEPSCMPLSTPLDRARGTLLGLAVGDALGGPARGAQPPADPGALRDRHRLRRWRAGLEAQALPLAAARALHRRHPAGPGAGRRAPGVPGRRPRPPGGPSTWRWPPPATATSGPTAASAGASARSSTCSSAASRRWSAARTPPASAPRCGSPRWPSAFADDPDGAVRRGDGRRPDDPPRRPEPGRGRWPSPPRSAGCSTARTAPPACSSGSPATWPPPSGGSPRSTVRPGSTRSPRTAGASRRRIARVEPAARPAAGRRPARPWSRRPTPTAPGRPAGGRPWASRRPASRPASTCSSTTESFEEALIDVVNLGGDADSAGAILGAMAGAHYGVGGDPRPLARRAEEPRGDRPPGPRRSPTAARPSRPTSTSPSNGP